MDGRGRFRVLRCWRHWCNDRECLPASPDDGDICWDGQMHWPLAPSNLLTRVFCPSQGTVALRETKRLHKRFQRKKLFLGLVCLLIVVAAALGITLGVALKG